MILRLLRRRAWMRFAATLLSLAVCGAAVNWGHAGGDDPGCDPALTVLSQVPTHAGSPSTGESPTDHCPICHFLRILTTAVSARSFQATGVVTTIAASSPEQVLAPSPLALNVASRAPPAILL